MHFCYIAMNRIQNIFLVKIHNWQIYHSKGGPLCLSNVNFGCCGFIPYLLRVYYLYNHNGIN